MPVELNEHQALSLDFTCKHVTAQNTNDGGIESWTRVGGTSRAVSRVGGISSAVGGNYNHGGIFLAVGGISIFGGNDFGGGR